MGNKVYILGAGFSRYAKLPLMNNFYSRSREIFKELNDDDTIKAFKDVYKFWEKYSQVKSYMNVDLLNIEELLSIIEMNSFLSEEKRNKKKNSYLIYLKTVIEKCTPDLKFENLNYFVNSIEDIYSKFISLVFGINFNFDHKDKKFIERNRKNNNGIISLNYDLLLEKILQIINDYKFNEIRNTNQPFLDFYYGLDENNYSRLENYGKKISLKYAKIHGSINFHKKDNNNIPLIIPPTWNKTSEKEMKPVWQLAYELLKNSEEIVFIGYSLPETDLYVKYLLINGINDCFNLKKITIVCPDDENENIRRRYEKFFPLSFRNKGKGDVGFEFIPKRFEEWIKEQITKPKAKITVKSFG